MSQDKIFIAQITDSHIMPQGLAWKHESTATSERLAQVVECINSLKPLPHLVLHTGDITENGEVPAYEKAKSILDNLKVPYYLLCGNHDDFNNLKAAFNSPSYYTQNNHSSFSIELNELKLINLDTTINGEIAGFISEERLKWLLAEIESSKSDILIFMHHYPFMVQHDLMQKYGLKNSFELEQLLLPYDNIQGFFCGHYHELSVTHFAGKICWSAQSTAPSVWQPDLAAKNYNYLSLHSPAFSLHQYSGGKVISRSVNVSEKVKVK